LNTRDVQEFLRELGWPLVVDSSFGPQTRQAVTDFQRGFTFWDLLVDGFAGPQTWNALQHAADEKGHAAPHFAFSEFGCHHCRWITVDRTLVRALEKYRSLVGPVQVVSAYRCITHNQSVGGQPNSQHLYGNAVDIPAVATVEQVRRLGVFSGIGYQANTHTVRHVDVRHFGPNTTNSTTNQPATWQYQK
jgi:zinc D-Ala-D-Ala carboxypeptidase